MLQIIIIPHFILALLLPKDFQRILNAMLRGPWCIGYGAIVGLGLLSESIEQGALIARGVIGINKQSLSLEAFGGSVDVVAPGIFGLLVDLEHNVIKIFTGLNIVQATDDDWELQVLAERDILHPFTMGGDFDAWASLADERGNCISLVMAHILLSEHELPVEVGEIYSVHIHQVNVPCSTQRQVFDYLAAEPACPDHHDGSLEDGFVVESPLLPTFLEGSFIGEQRGQIGEQFLQRYGRTIHARINYMVYRSLIIKPYNQVFACLFLGSNQFDSSINLQMSLQEKLQYVFPNQFQINRVVKEIDTLKDAKQKLGLQVRYLSRQNVQFVVIIEIAKQRLKEMKKLAFLNKLQFKIVMKSSYPTEPPHVYILNENAIQLGINPFHNYLKSIYPEWGPKVSIIDIIKQIPAFIVQSNQKSKEIIGERVAREYFQAERLFSFIGCQVFPVKLLRGNTTFNGMISLVNGEEIVLLQQSSYASSYIATDYIKITEVYSVQKHKTKHLRAMLEIKRNGKKFAVQFSSDQYDTIISLVVEKMKAIAIFDKDKASESQEDSDQDLPVLEKEPSQDIAITEHNINQVDSQILILQSLVDSKPTSSNIKQLVDLLKKAVEYYSIKGDERCHVHLKSLQNIMNNEFMQVMLASEDQSAAQHEKRDYESIANYV